MSEETDKALIFKIANTANNVAFHAGVGGMEIAGMIVSVLAAHPEITERFMRDDWSIIDEPLMSAEHGCLTFFTAAGPVGSPEAARLASAARKLLLKAGARPPADPTPKAGE